MPTFGHETISDDWEPFKNDKICFLFYLKDTHREKAPSSKTPTLTKSMNMDIWVVGTSNQLFLRGS